MDFNEDIDDIEFSVGADVGNISCTEVEIIADSVAEEEESFNIVLQSNDVVQAVPPSVSTIVIGEQSQ